MNKILKDWMLLKDYKDITGRIYDPDEIAHEADKGIALYGILGEAAGDGSTPLDKVSHIVRNLRVTDDGLIGDIEILQTPMGQMLSSLLEYDAPLRTCMRAVGHYDADTKKVSEVTIYAFDMVKKDD